MFHQQYFDTYRITKFVFHVTVLNELFALNALIIAQAFRDCALSLSSLINSYQSNYGLPMTSNNLETASLFSEYFAPILKKTQFIQ